ncbi:unnamed protein product [Calypogeia fissa]
MKIWIWSVLGHTQQQEFILHFSGVIGIGSSRYLSTASSSKETEFPTNPKPYSGYSQVKQRDVTFANHSDQGSQQSKGDKKTEVCKAERPFGGQACP